MEDWVNLISNVGFPIVITLYFMFRMEKTINANTKIIYELKEVMIKRRR